MKSPVFPAIHLSALDEVELPPLMRVKLSHPRADGIEDIEGAVTEALTKARRLNALGKGAEVAVAIGSRGITDLARIAAATVTYLKGQGFNVFIVPAMGSHGGATPEGQTAVLANLGVTEESVGAPIRATMEVVEYGKTAEGIPCCFDKNAAGADGIVVINRVKSHTTFDRPIESGLVKMVAIGLGKAQGAHFVHTTGPRGMSEVLPEIARVSLANGPIVCGIALVENAEKQKVVIEGVEPEDFFTADERLLRRAKELLARLPFDRMDAMIVEQIGKDISGAGMDYAVNGRADIRGVDNPPTPFVAKIGVLGLTPATHGNANGLGLADFTTIEVAAQLDLDAMYWNAITSAMVEKARIPMALPDERDVLRACAATCWNLDPAEARMCVIRSTLHLHEILVSPSLFADIDGRQGVEVLAEPEPIVFSEQGKLLTRCS
jgi:hypothetical protein